MGITVTEIMTDTKQPEALRLADAMERFTKSSHWWTDGEPIHIAVAAELRRLQSENEQLRAGYDAARLEIESLQAQARQCGAGAGCCAQAARIEELEAQLETVGAGGVGAAPWCEGCTPENCSGCQTSGFVPAARLEIASLQARIAELEAARFAYASEFAPTPDGDPDVGIIHANIRALKTLVASLHTQMESVGAGGMEPLRKAVEAEREMCANLCEQQRFGIDAFGSIDHHVRQAAEQCAAAIRAR